MIVPFVLAGSGMALVFAPSANAMLASVRTDQAGQASGATNAIRELGGVLGVAVLATVFTSAGGYGSPQAFVNGSSRRSGSGPRCSPSARCCRCCCRSAAGTRRPRPRHPRSCGAGGAPHPRRPASRPERRVIGDDRGHVDLKPSRASASRRPSAGTR